MKEDKEIWANKSLFLGNLENIAWSGKKQAISTARISVEAVTSQAYVPPALVEPKGLLRGMDLR